jgi:hypothetical protein
MLPFLREEFDQANRVLEVGAGDGWFAMSVENMGISDGVTTIDINTRLRLYSWPPVETTLIVRLRRPSAPR